MITEEQNKKIEAVVEIIRQLQVIHDISDDDIVEILNHMISQSKKKKQRL